MLANFFAADYGGPAFVLFGPSHFIALGAIVLLSLFLIGQKAARQETKAIIRWVLAIGLVVNEIAWHIWNIDFGRWTIQTMLPLQLCSIMVWASAIMLLAKNHTIYEFCYFLGIGGAFQAVLTPDLGIYGFPHFRFFQTFISHGLIIASAVYMTGVEGFRPTWRSLVRVVLWTNLYVVIIFFINSAIGSDYLMLNAKPATPSLLDTLPAWPGYLIFMELIGIATCVLLYLPFLARVSEKNGTSLRRS
jgi:hypothetical integral membrane protein (TIGR02206 family)